LTVISGYAQGLKTGIFEDPEQTLDKIVDECQGLKSQLENVIFLSKLDSLEEPYHFERLELNRLIIESLEKVESLIILDEIDVLFTPTNDIFIKGDHQKLRKALVNILTNCLKYTKSQLSIHVKQKEGQASVSIKDDGPGFSDEILENAFSRSYIGEKGGTGLGLCIIKRVVEGHKGRISLENVHPRGAKYHVQLPL